MSRKLEKELSDQGCRLSPTEFRELLEAKKAATYPDWTFDDLVCHPDAAKAFCEEVRREPTCEKLNDYLILRTLLNARKAH